MLFRSSPVPPPHYFVVMDGPPVFKFAVGAMDETGWAYVAPHAKGAGADDAYLARETHEQLQLLRQRRALYTPARPPIDPKGRLVIVVDDGLATGATMMAALHAARAKGPERLVCAVPVAALHVLYGIQQGSERPVFPAARFLVPVETVRALENARLVVVRGGLRNESRHGFLELCMASRKEDRTGKCRNGAPAAV